MTVPSLQKHLVSGLGSTLGFFTRATTVLPFREVSLLALALLETSGFTNHQQLMLLLDLYFCGVKHREYLKDHHICPWYIIVHHEALAAWCNDFEETSLSHLEDQLPLDSSDCCAQTIWAQAQWLSFSPLVCRLRKSSQVSYLLAWARAWNPNFSPRNISYVSRRFKTSSVPQL